MAKWIWLYGDFELYHHRELCLHRRERGAVVPAFWKVFDCHRNAVFSREIDLPEAVTLHAAMDGEGCMLLDGQRMAWEGGVEVPPGRHLLSFAVGNGSGIPALLVEGPGVETDESWYATDGTKTRYPVGCWSLSDPAVRPGDFRLPTVPMELAGSQPVPGGRLYDLGREAYARLTLTGLTPDQPLRIVYGESREEAMSDDRAVISLSLTPETPETTLPGAACRCFRVLSSVQPGITAACELLPMEAKGSFTSNDPLLDTIWRVAEYTLHLNSRVFYLDGIKRDGWVWGGDAYQSFFCNYYCHFEPTIIQRTLLALRGGDPIACHVNTILDYSLYWLISLQDYLLYTGDRDFLGKIYDSARALLAYCSLRELPNGLLQGFPEDWTFIDWADMRKDGALACEQMLYAAALEAMAVCGEALGRPEAGACREKAAGLRKKVNELYWSEARGAYLTTVTAEGPAEEVRRHANIFAVLFGFADAGKQAKILENVLRNPAVPPITTPYFRLFELEALCKLGETAAVAEEIRSYWGGMLENGATTFWEEYDPRMEGEAHYAMYGEPYDKSLCHAWGAGPLYLMGRYMLGVTPTAEGYSRFTARPDTAGLASVSGTVPTGKGDIHVQVSGGFAEITTALPGGSFLRGGRAFPILPGLVNRFPMD